MYDFQNFLFHFSLRFLAQTVQVICLSSFWIIFFTGGLELNTFYLFLFIKDVFFLELETEAEIYEKLGYYLWSPGGNGQNARYQVSFDFGTNLTCDTKINDIKVLLIYFHFKLLRTTYDFTSKYFIVLQIFCYFSIF